SAPFPKGSSGHRLPPHQVALLALVARRLSTLGVPVGVNCLRNDIMAALGIAAAAGLAFVRVNVHTGAYVTDQGVIEGEADASLRYRASLGASGVRIMADCLVKHAQSLVPVDPIASTHDCLHRGLADGVVVTGTATGAPIDLALLRQIHRAAGDAPVWLGSGVSPEAADSLVPMADAAIVGTWVKEGGKVKNPVSRERVKTLANALRARFRSR
ncbi:MAG TPA: BtpA/SgcQ family protein, partial [Myxococcota bacterium]|nr:BtpA/SgcQ family protein [Myxococcota bacterium]